MLACLSIGKVLAKCSLGDFRGNTVNMLVPFGAGSSVPAGAKLRAVPRTVRPLSPQTLGAAPPGSPAPGDTGSPPPDTRPGLAQ